MAPRRSLVPPVFLLALLIAGAAVLQVARAEPDPDERAAVQPDKCNVDVSGLLAKCGPFIMGGGPETPPSADCCGVLKATDIPCACGMINGKLPVNIDMVKVCFVLSQCGKPLPPGYKCGGYVMPKC